MGLIQVQFIKRKEKVNKMLKAEWKKYFDGEFQPDSAYSQNDACIAKEHELEEHLRKYCRNAFSSDDAYTEFEDKVFEIIGALQVVASEVSFEKGILCGLKISEE